MNTDSYLDRPHYKHPPRGTVSSADYEAGEESSTSSMDRHNAAGYNNNSASSLGYPHDAYDPRSKQQQQHHQTPPVQQQQHSFSNSSQPLSGFATPESSPQSQSSGHQRSGSGSGNGTGAYHYSSGSEEDHESFPSREPPLLNDLSGAESYRVRRDSGLPIKMTAAKRLPPFGANLSSIPAGSHIVEEEEEEEIDDQMDRCGIHEDDIESIPLDDDEQEALQQMRDRDFDARQVNDKSRKGGSKQRTVPTTASNSVKSSPSPLASAPSSQGHRTPQVHPIRPPEPDRGPADLSNPSMALAEALIAARSKAESKAKTQQQQQQSQQQSSSGTTSSNGHSSFSYVENEHKQTQSNTQIRIPVPDLSPSLRGYPSHSGRQQDLERNPEGLLYTRKTSFTLSPTSSNPELAESQTDSHSGSYRTPRPNLGGGLSAHHAPSASTKYNSRGNRPIGPSISSTMSRYSDDYQQQQRQHPSQYKRESSLLGTSYDSANSAQQDGDLYSRYTYPGQELEQGSLPSQGYTESLQHSPRDTRGQSKEGYASQRLFGSSAESASHHYSGDQGNMSSKAFQKQRQDHKQNGRAEPSTSAVSGNGFPATSSSHSLGLSEDLQDQLTTEAEYIMNRNTELLRILNIRDEEIQTLQQELDHTLKVMHEYEDDLMAMHTAAAKPYESYHQTLDQIGREMTQQEALLQGYQQENEKLTTQLKSSVELRQEAEKRHLQTVERLKNEMAQLRSELDSSDQEKYGNADLRVLLKQAQESHERTRKNLKDKEEEHQAEIADLKERLRVTEQILDEERRVKTEDMQKLEREVQDFRAGYDGMLAQLQSLIPSYRRPHSKRASSLSSADDNQADTTVDLDLEKDIGLIRASALKTSTEPSICSKLSSPSPPLSDSQQQQKGSKNKLLDRKLTSTETLTTASMPNHADGDKLDLEERLSKFEADVRKSLMRTASVESFISVRSSTGTVIPLSSQTKNHQHHNGSSREDLRLSALSEQHKLANKLRDRINTLNVENKRLHKELSSLSLVLRQQQAERQRRVNQLEELLDMHENAANQRLDDANTDEGQARIRKVIQGLLVRIRTKEAEAEFYHNAYLDKVLELDQMALANGKNQVMENHLDEGHAQAVVEGLSIAAAPTSGVEALEARVKELERINMETAFRLAAEQRRAQAAEAENATLVREKLTLARMLEDQVDQLQSKLSAAEIAKAKLQDENTTLRQQGPKDQQQGERGHPNGQESAANAAEVESVAIMRTRMLSLTKQRDQLREQLQEAFDIQLTMQDRSAGGVPEWSVDDYKRLEKALEERTSELGAWKERAVALEKVVERIRMIKDKPEPTGLSLERSSTRDSDSVVSTSSAGGRSQHHTLEELDQVVLRLEQRLERRDQELQEVVLEAKRQTDQRLEAWKAKWVQVVQRKNAEIHRFQVELESLMTAVDRDRARMAASMKK
ncbi:hypothetical protein BGZ54_003418 [Gamsiella multidivaricata]|nr:hypothetical protein BGZ54_003418 [Gamsiella multidivaricata]